MAPTASAALAIIEGYCAGAIEEWATGWTNPGDGGIQYYIADASQADDEAIILELRDSRDGDAIVRARVALQVTEVPS